MYMPQGFGDASDSCPSIQQLLGITDPNDPCQQGAVGPSAALSSGCYPSTFVGALPPGASYCGGAPTGLPAPQAASACPVGSTCTIFAGVPNTGVYALGAIVLGFFVVSMMGGHR
jgi:hypothetical protein